MSLVVVIVVVVVVVVNVGGGGAFLGSQGHVSPELPTLGEDILSYCLYDYRMCVCAHARLRFGRKFTECPQGW